MNFETVEIGNLVADGYTEIVNTKHLKAGTFQVIKTGVTTDLRILFEASLNGTDWYSISEDEIILITTKNSEAYTFSSLQDYVRVGIELLTAGSVKILFKGGL